MTREEAIKILKAIRVYECYPKSASEETKEAIDMAIDALQREDEFLKNLESNEPQVYDEDDCWNGRVPTHGRLIDAHALSKKLCETTIFIKDGEVFQRMINDAPTVQADRPHGEWVADTESMTINCPICGEKFGFDDVDEMLDYKEYAYFCIHCGADMRKETE